MTALCLVLAAGTALALPVPDGAFTLAWRHSVEKTWWREDYRIEEDGRLRLVRAAVEGSGAGMDPPPEARLEDGAWVWRPDVLVPELHLAHSAFGGDYRLCAAGIGCRPLAGLVPRPEGAGGVTVAPCKG